MIGDTYSSVSKNLFVLAGLLALTAAIRWPFFTVTSPDEPFFAETARQWLDGRLPYAAAFDVKPPGLFAYFAGLQALGGDSFAVMRAGEIFCSAMTAFVLFVIGRRHFTAAAGLFAAGLYPFYTMAINNVAAGPALLFAAWGMVFAFAGGARRAALAGLLLGAACTIKQTAAFEALAALIAVVAATPAPGRRVAALAFLSAAAAPAAAFLAYFAANGAVGPLIDDVVRAALARSGGETEGVQGTKILIGFFANCRPLLVPVILASLALLRLKTLRTALPEAPWTGLAAWLGLTTAAVFAQHASYEGYMSPTFAPMLLFAGLCLECGMPELAGFTRDKRLAGGAVVALALCAAVKLPMDDYREDLDATRRVAEMVAASPHDAQARLFVVNRGMWAYAMTRLRPPTAIFHPMHLLCDFPGAGPGALAEALAARPTFVLVADERIGFACEKPEAWNEVHAALDHYVSLAHVVGASESFDLYRLK